MSGPQVEIQEITDEVLANYYAAASKAKEPKAEPAPEDNLAPATTATATTATAPTTRQPSVPTVEQSSVPTVDLSPGPILQRRYRRFDDEPEEPRKPTKRKKKKKSKAGFDWGWVLIPALALLFLTSRGGPAPPMNMGTSGLASLL